MPVVRPSAVSALRAARSAVKQASSSCPSTMSTALVSRRHLSCTQIRAASHGSQYDPPTGWLFGVKPGEKYQKEGWEGLFFYGFCGSLIVFTIAYAFKPDTS